MVFCGTSSPERRASKELEKKISLWMKDYKKAIKILLLGAGESGKTTIIKQMKILHISGFTPEEKQERAQDIKSNVLESITTLARNLDVLGIPLANDANTPSLQYVRDIQPEGFTFPTVFYEHVGRLWRDAGVQAVYEQQHTFQLIDCSKYFLDKVDVLGQPNYEPTVQDILHSRRRTTNIQKIEFEVKIPRKYGGGGSLNFWMFDVGGQRGERKKWIQVFDGIQTVLFLVSASCFDLVVREDDETNRLQESIDIFEKVWISRFLKDSGFIVFLNKQDILKEKVVHAKKNIGDYFPDYANYRLESKDVVPGEEDEYLRTRCFIRDKFLKIAKRPLRSEARKVSPGWSVMEEERERECYCHFTTATDTDNVKLVFEDVHNMIIMWNLHEIGIKMA